MATLSLTDLLEKLADPEWAALRIHSDLQPAAGEGARIFPPTYPVQGPGDSPYLLEKRLRNGEAAAAAILDQVPSQANRVEEALGKAWASGLIKMPMFVLEHGGASKATILGLQAPHRAFDAYWRDSLLDGTKFDKTVIGESLQAADLSDATALLKHDPSTLAFGGWNSHRPGRQAKFPRVYSSEIIGWNPIEGTRKAGRMDPLNLQGSRSGDGDDWKFSVGAKAKNSKLSEIGHGNIAPNSTHGGVTISAAQRTASISLTMLRRIGFGDVTESRALAARAFIAAYILAGDRLAFGSAGIWLRSGCDLVVETEVMEFVGRGGVVEPVALTADEAVTLYEQALAFAQEAGVEFELSPVNLAPSPALAQAIEFSLLKAEATEA